MVGDEAAGALVPGVSTLDDPALGLHDEAWGNRLGPQRGLSIAPIAGTAVGAMDRPRFRWFHDDDGSLVLPNYRPRPGRR